MKAPVSGHKWIAIKDIAQGLEIEKLHVAKIKNKNGITATPTSSDYLVIDAYILIIERKR